MNNDIPEEDDYEDDEQEEMEQNHTRASSLSSAQNSRFNNESLVEPEGEEDEDMEDEEEENRTPSPGYQKYLNYFKGDTRSEDPFIMPRSRYSSPVGSPYSTAATVGSPSFRNRSYNFDDSADDSEPEQPVPLRQNKIRNALNKVNPLNWMPNPKAWFTKSREAGEHGYRNQANVDFNFGSRSSSYSPTFSSPTSSSRYSITSTSSGTNGHYSSSSTSPGRANLANQIYSPAQPPAPAVAAGRQAGFTAFFSRGERNGVGHGHTAGTLAPTDKSHVIPTLILVGFLGAGLGILGMYYYKASMQPSLPGPGPEVEFNQMLNQQQQIGAPVVPSSKPKRQIPPAKLNYAICSMPGYESEVRIML